MGGVRKERMCTKVSQLKPIYSYPEQLVFIDETSKDGRLPISRGNRVSVVAALGTKGFISWRLQKARSQGIIFMMPSVKMLCHFLTLGLFHILL